ncbi:MAG: transposase [Thermoguttaceae bacterium]
MPRPLRFDFPNAIYHVTSRGNGRSVIFRSDADRLRFLAQLADNLHLAGIALYAYVLMDKCFHLLLRTPRANLSRFMQRLCTAYATYTRSKHRRRGRQFQGRFQAKLVQGGAYLRAVSRYVHLIPIRTAACRRLDRQARRRLLKAYPWSSYPGYLVAKNARQFVTYDVLHEFLRDAAAARRQYRAFVEQCLLEDDPAILAAMEASRYAIGDDRFVARTERSIERRRTANNVCRDRALPRRMVSLAVIDKTVAQHFRVVPADLARHGRSVGAAKIVAVELACRLTELSQRAIGEHYGGIGSAAVSTIHRKVRNGQHAVEKLLAAVLQKLGSRV